MQTRAIALGSSILDNYSQWYADGTFHNSYGAAWEYSTGGPAALCASMYRATGDHRYLDVCSESFDYMCDNLVGTDGTYRYYVGEAAAPATALEAIAVCGALSWAMTMAGDVFGRDRMAKYMRFLKDNTAWLESIGELLWFDNGNWVVDKIRYLYDARALCRRMQDHAGDVYFTTLYERTYTFLLTPWLVPTPTAPSGDPKWNSYGLVTDTAGALPDWSDYLIHLTEVKTGPPMPNAGAGTSWDDIAPFTTYDLDYAGLQLDHLSAWYATSRDYRALKLLNGVVNKYMDPATTNQTTWVGNVPHGSRHYTPANPIYTPALGVLALIGERQVTGTLAAPFTDAKVLSEWDVQIIPTFNQYDHGNVPPGIARSYLNTIGVLLYACELATAAL